MMFTCVTPGCSQPGHYHPAMAASRKSASRKSRPGKHGQAVVRDKKGHSLRVDIHCHYLNKDAAAKMAPLNPAQYEPQIKFANALTREVNVKQMQDRGAEALDDRVAPQGHGPHGHRHPGGVARAAADLLLGRAGPGPAKCRA